MSKTINVQDSLVFNPTAYDSSSTWNSSYISGTSNACTSTSNTSNYARFSLRNSTSYTAIYNFNISGIPSGATITSVTGQVRAAIQNTSYTASVQLYSGTTAKGSSTNINSTTGSTSGGSLWTVNGGTSWTLEEVSNLKLRFVPNNVSSNNNRYLYVYGADISVNYSISGTAYTITVSSSVTGVTADPTTQDILVGGSGTVYIYGISDLGDVTVTDNTVDVTNQLVKQTVSEGSIEKYPGTQTTSGISSGSSYAAYAVGRSAESPYSSTSNMYASSGSTGYAEYPFDFSEIPSNATIESVTVKAYGHRESSTTDASHVAKIGLYSGNTLKSTEQEFTSTSNRTITISDPGTWTLAELQSAKLRFSVGYYGGLLLGVTWAVTYSVETSSYYTYTLSGLNDDHVILIEEAGAFVPPDEDPQYNYYPITISSINATTTPSTGTTRVVEGSNQTVTIYPDDPLVTLILDNGQDVSSQLVSHAGTQPSYTVTTSSVTSYGFNLNSSTGYYVSTNVGVNNSSAIARVSFDLPVRCLVTVTYINYAEATYDYGIFGNIDTALSANYPTSEGVVPDTNYKYACVTSGANTNSEQTITYEIDSGQHFIDVKYTKDQGTSSNNDNLQFKIAIEALEPINYYTYTLTNIQQKHSLIFVFGNVQYYYVTSSGSNCKLYPDGQFVELEGDNYRLTIVPDDPSSSISVTDNGTNVTSQLTRVESQVEKDGATITYVNYIYALVDIRATHNIIVSSTSNSTVLIKVGGNWLAAQTVYKKINDHWQEVSDYSNLFDGDIYINIT